MIESKKYLIENGRVYEICGKDGFGRNVCRLTELTEIPKDEPLKKPETVEVEEEPEKPKRTRKK